LTVAATAPAPAQTIPIQTVPLVPADQFDILPVLHARHGGVSIALPDTLHDPFVNPAKGARVRAARFLPRPPSTTSPETLERDAHCRSVCSAGPVRVRRPRCRPPTGRREPPPFTVPEHTPALRQHGRSIGQTVSCPVRKPGPAPDTHATRSRFALIGYDAAGIRALARRQRQLGQTARARRRGPALSRQRARHAIRRNSRCALRPPKGMGRRTARSKRSCCTSGSDDPRCDFLDTFWDPGTQQFSQSARLERNRDVLQALGRAGQIRASAPGAGMAHRLAGDRHRTSQPTRPTPTS